MTTTPFIRLLAPVAAVLRNPAAHGCPDLPPVPRYRVRLEGYQTPTQFEAQILTPK